MDWKELYRQKLTTADEAVKRIKSGDRVAVSYTHLDVYKRQLRGRARRRGAPRPLRDGQRRHDLFERGGRAAPRHPDEGKGINRIPRKAADFTGYD